MPVQPCTEKDKPGWKYGATGKCYTGKDAKEKATQQGRAINASETIMYSNNTIKK